MSATTSGCWVGVSTRLGLVERVRAASGVPAPPFDGEPVIVEILPPDTRRLPQTAVRRCFDLLAPLVGESFAAVDLLLVFAGDFATAWAHRLVVAVDEESARVRPTDSTNMEASETIRAALSSLGRGRPRSTIVLAAAFDAELVASLSAGCPSVLVVRIELHGPEPENCDVLAAHTVADRPGGTGHD